MPQRQPIRFSSEPNVAEIASLIGDRGRASILLALLDGRELPASELASKGGLSPQAATAHLKKLVGAGLLEVRSLGRHRLFRLASPNVGHALEMLAAIAPPTRVVALSQASTMQRMREARSCYDHLAGRLGVGITEYLLERDAVRLAQDEFAVTRSGERLLHKLGIELAPLQAARRSFARVCLDWTERRPHLGGSLGAEFLALFLERKWIARNTSDRALRITTEGRNALAREYRLEF